MSISWIRLYLTGLTLVSIAAGPASAADEFYKIRTNKTDFRFYELGLHVPSRAGRKPFPLARFVAAPDIGLPMDINPKAGENMYCNSQYYNLGGGGAPQEREAPKVGVDSPENYYFPWTSNFCEKRGRTGDKVCGTQYQEHMGQDCRPPSPTPAPKYWVLAVDDGMVGSLGDSTNAVAVANGRFRWVYLHMANLQVRSGQHVNKGQRLGQVWNVMKGGTSEHLHIELQFMDKGQYRHLDPLPSLIAAYLRALDKPTVINEDGTFATDTEFEIRGGTAPVVTPVNLPVASACADTEGRPSLGTETAHAFSTLWCHNGSLMGLVEAEAKRKLVYYKARTDDLANSVKGDPVLVDAVVTGGAWSGAARHYSSRCGNRQFAITGSSPGEGKRIRLSGMRDSFTGANCDAVSKVDEDLAFVYVGLYPRPSGAPPPAAPLAPIAAAPETEGPTPSDKLP